MRRVSYDVLKLLPHNITSYEKIINAYESADKRAEDKKPVRSVSGRYQRKKTNEQH